MASARQKGKLHAGAESGAPVQFVGRRLAVLHDPALCAATGECERAQGEFFVSGRTPWCDPDAAVGKAKDDEQATGQLAVVLSRCPTGALSATTLAGEALVEAAAPNQVTVANDGPLYFRGQLQLEGAPAESPALQRRMALCRCGHSKNKPHCDGSHRGVFVDSGAVGNAGTGGAGDFSGPLQIKPMAEGPLIVRGRFAMVSGTGRVAWSGVSTALCRCGQSGNKPFCDGTHSCAPKKTS